MLTKLTCNRREIALKTKVRDLLDKHHPFSLLTNSGEYSPLRRVALEESVAGVACLKPQGQFIIMVRLID